MFQIRVRVGLGLGLGHHIFQGPFSFFFTKSVSYWNLCLPLFALLVGTFSCCIGCFCFEVVVKNKFDSEDM